MATNTGKGFRRGAVKKRSQVKNSRTKKHAKQDDDKGQFIADKRSGKKFKGVAKEPDKRRKAS